MASIDEDKDGKKIYNVKWETEPEFQDWLAPVLNKPQRASCQICEKEFAATRTTLAIHANGKRHIERLKDLALKIELIENPDTSGSSNEEHEDKKLSKWHRYKKRYSHKWEQDPSIKDWIKPHPTNDSKVMCTICDTTLRAHKSDLYKHLESQKHRENSTHCPITTIETSSPIKENGSIIIHQLEAEPLEESENDKQKRKIERVYRDDGSYLIIESDGGVFQHEPPDDFVDDEELEDNSFEKMHIPPYKRLKQMDEDVSNIANKIGHIILRDMRQVLRRHRGLLKAIENETFSQGEDGLERMARVLVGHLAQHYLIESALNSWKGSRKLKGDGHDDIAKKLEALEEKMEKSVLELRNMKLELGGESSRGQMGISFDALQFADLAHEEDQGASLSINL